VFPGVVRKVVSVDTVCIPEFCYEKVWYDCYQNRTEEGAAGQQDADWCGLAVLWNTAFDCEGDIRPLYGIDCGDCIPCRCPDPEEVLTAILRTDDQPCQSAIDELELILNPVSANPVDPIGSTAGWWAEWTLVGSYPKVGNRLPVDPFTYSGEEFTDVFIVPVGDGVAECDIEVWLEFGDGHWEQYTGGFTPTGPLESFEAEVQAGAEEDFCTIFYERSYRYGMFMSCEDGEGIASNKIYHLHFEGTPLVTGLQFTFDNGLKVPTSNMIIPDGPMSSLEIEDECCEDFYLWDVDITGGDTSPDCTSGLFSGAWNNMKWHVFGGCQCWIYDTYGTGVPQALPNSCCDPPGVPRTTSPRRVWIEIRYIDLCPMG
jgi:hypothetical protein